MDEKLSYDYLWQACQKEKQTNQLLLLPKTFYEDVGEFVNRKPLAKEDSLTTRENASKLLSEFFERRKQKILLYVAYERPLPQPIANLELEFYNKVLEVVKSEKLTMQKETGTKSLLKSIKDIPEIILPSGNRFGPVKIGETFESISEQDKVYLIENSICEKV
jgi:DNA replication initiation complex subunit (GINS family)